MRLVLANNVKISNNLPFVLIAGPCQVESKDHALMIAQNVKKICDKLNEIAAATELIRSVKSQIAEHIEAESDETKKENFEKASKPIVDSLTAIEEQLYNPLILAYEDNLKFPIMLEEKIAGLNYFLQMADTAPTKTMYTKYDDLTKRIDVQLNKLKQIVAGDIKSLNEMAGEQKSKAIDLD